MKIYIASDHAGYELKAPLIDYITSLNHQIVDLGPATNETVDYPDYAKAVCEKIQPNGDGDIGILICGSGQGMAIAANRFPHIRAALCFNTEMATLARAHNHANILTMGARQISLNDSKHVIDSFLKTSFEKRHEKRIKKLN